MIEKGLSDARNRSDYCAVAFVVGRLAVMATQPQLGLLSIWDAGSCAGDRVGAGASGPDVSCGGLEVGVNRQELFEDIKRNPARIYRTPGDVLRDRRFGDPERLEILRAWRGVKGQPDVAALDATIAELENRLRIADGHAAA
jgi:hypothetical protein